MGFAPRISLAILLVVCSPLLAEVKVTVTPVAAKSKTFSPSKPPADMPPLKGDEAAVTQSKFACGVQLDVEISQVGNEKPIAKIAGVDATLKLDVTEWLPTNATKKIKAHEDGHRKIAEAFYANAEHVAKDLGEKYVGRAIDLPGINAEENKPIIQRVANEFCQEFLGKIEQPSEAAQDRYDQITDHGRNKVVEATAIQQALEEAVIKP